MSIRPTSSTLLRMERIHSTYTVLNKQVSEPGTWPHYLGLSILPEVFMFKFPFPHSSHRHFQDSAVVMIQTYTIYNIYRCTYTRVVCFWPDGSSSSFPICHSHSILLEYRQYSPSGSLAIDVFSARHLNAPNPTLCRIPRPTSTPTEPNPYSDWRELRSQ